MLGTLESRYDARIRELQRRKDSVPERKRRVQALEARLKEICSDADPDAYYAVKDELKAERDALAVIDSGNEMVEYMLDSMPFIAEYETTTKPTVGERVGSMDEFVHVSSLSNKSRVYKRYSVQVEGLNDDNYVADTVCATRDVVCPECDASLALNARESTMVCLQCGHTSAYMELSEANLSYEQKIGQDVVSSFSYKRHNHFCEWLNSLQARLAKENTEIPQDVIDALKQEFRKAKATTRCEIKPARVRAYLKKIGLNRYYEHVHSICNLLSGMPAPTLPAELEDRLKAMFQEIQEPFDRACPKNRKNFLSYSYVLYKFCELLGEDTYLPYFPLLKSSEKLFQQDCIWKAICKDLGWEYIRSSNV